MKVTFLETDDQNDDIEVSSVFDLSYPYTNENVDSNNNSVRNLQLSTSDSVVEPKRSVSVNSKETQRAKPSPSDFLIEDKLDDKLSDSKSDQK